MSFQLYVSEGCLDLQVYQRSVDVPVGLPYNLASYGLLCHLLAHEVGLTPRYLIHMSGDAHIYDNQKAKIGKQLTRYALNRETVTAPRLRLNKTKSMQSLIYEDKPEDFRIENYNPLGFIKFPVEV